MSDEKTPESVRVEAEHGREAAEDVRDGAPRKHGPRQRKLRHA
jgi:hypothetical protein